MGQGLHTKMIQIASKTLNVPYENIHYLETATDKVDCENEQKDLNTLDY